MQPSHSLTVHALPEGFWSYEWMQTTAAFSQSYPWRYDQDTVLTENWFSLRIYAVLRSGSLSLSTHRACWFFHILPFDFFAALEITCKQHFFTLTAHNKYCTFTFAYFFSSCTTNSSFQQNYVHCLAFLSRDFTKAYCNPKLSGNGSIQNVSWWQGSWFWTIFQFENAHFSYLFWDDFGSWGLGTPVNTSPFDSFWTLRYQAGSPCALS